MRFPISLLFVLAACSKEVEPAGDVVIALDCGWENVIVAPDDATTLGATPGELLAPHLGSFTLQGTWDTGDSTEVSLTIAQGAGDVSLMRPTGADAASCPTFLTLPVDLTLATADGLLDERLTAGWSADPAGPFDVLKAIGRSWPSDLVGTFVVDPHVDPNEDYGDIEFEVVHDASGVRGAMRLEVSGNDGEIAWDGITEVLTFGP